MLIPSRTLVWGMVGLLAAAITVSAWSILQPFWWPFCGLLAAITLFDLLWLMWEGKAVEVQRLVPGSLPVGLLHAVKLHVSHRLRRMGRVQLFDQHPPSFLPQNLPLDLRIPPGRFAEVSYQVQPLERGEHPFGRCAVRLTSPLRLWQRQFLAGTAETVKVYPNFAAIVRYALLATDNRLSQIGVLQRRRRGEGMDFRQLREYREGDTQRQVDWKATSRMNKLISREYQDERDQQVVFMLDCGRRMLARDGELSHFDHTLNAMLLLAYVALRQGDAVGLTTFATDQPRYFAPRKSDATVNTLLNSVFDLQPSLRSPDYYQAAVDLITRLRKRSLVVILSNLRDEDDSTLAPALALLRKRHLVLFVSLREQSLEQTLQQPITTLEEGLTYAATGLFLNQREAMMRKLGSGGVLTLDTEPQHLAIELVNQYLELKKSARL
ncbi:DUF58 domain-containing protein [Leeia aquatica]|uniref:DUF58 domain-containing protein n=1 Tax=Leeia aquatica TaxID=2725557 RepID=A0A847SCS7_9NEIS|nr:DUF58 domain-containing protein [Leeia aquatica]NLR75276.1 DUF58 domain-containing protein [Leeia aquatica]